jgi:hypothetical protein
MTTITESRGRLIIAIDPEPQNAPLGRRVFRGQDQLTFNTEDSSVTAGLITRDWVRKALANPSHNPSAQYLGDLTIERAGDWGLQ